MESSNQIYTTTSVNEYMKEMRRRYETTPSSKRSAPNEHVDKPKSKKRTYEESFGAREYDVERYGQEIDESFFQTNVGHGVM